MKTLEQTTTLISEEVTAQILDEIEQYDDSTYEDVFYDLFNSDYWIIGTYQAKEWLDKVGTLNCIQIITDWEKEMFGEVEFDEFDNPEKIVNLVVYCVADTLWNEMLWETNQEQDDYVNVETVIKYFEQ